MTLLAGVDIGGTKCAVCLGEVEGVGPESSPPRILAKRRFPTPATPSLAMEAFVQSLDELFHSLRQPALKAVGVSCGGPLDSRRGLILSPPNLPGWDHIDVLTPFREHFGVPAALQNDANACALAEWKWGAGRGCRNMVFLTFGTGMGAGLILDGRLYSGANDLGGEVGHIRLEPDGPVGYNKAGSFEGFCSGGGIAQLARRLAEKALEQGHPALFCPAKPDLAAITAEKVGQAAQQGDPLALQVFAVVARYLGRGLAVLVDILNPERIVIGSIYARQRSLLEERTLQSLREEALPLALSVCQVAPAELGESVGDLAALAVAMETMMGTQASRR